jgi:hypothetical protein
VAERLISLGIAAQTGVSARSSSPSEATLSGSCA